MAGDVSVLSEASTSVQATVMRCDNSLVLSEQGPKEPCGLSAVWLARRAGRAKSLQVVFALPGVDPGGSVHRLGELCVGGEMALPEASPACSLALSS